MNATLERPSTTSRRSSRTLGRVSCARCGQTCSLLPSRSFPEVWSEIENPTYQTGSSDSAYLYYCEPCGRDLYARLPTFETADLARTPH